MSVEINEVVLPVNSGYGADSIQVLEGLEAVRKRPAMILGNRDGHAATAKKGRAHLSLRGIIFTLARRATDDTPGHRFKRVAPSDCSYSLVGGQS